MTEPPFDEFVDQSDDHAILSIPWVGTNQDKQDLLEEVGSFALQFAIARIFRYDRLRGKPRDIKVTVKVEVAGDESLVQKTT